MLVAMRMEMEGLSARDACDAVLRDNIHDLEIDQRCVELAAFALALTAWRYPGEDGKAIGYRSLPGNPGSGVGKKNIDESSHTEPRSPGSDI